MVFEIVVLLGQELFTRRLRVGGWSLKWRWCLLGQELFTRMLQGGRVVFEMVVVFGQLFTRKLQGGKVVFEMEVVFGQELFTRKLQGGKVVFEMEVVFGQELLTRKLQGGEKWSLKWWWCLVRSYLQGSYKEGKSDLWNGGGTSVRSYLRGSYQEKVVIEMVVLLGQELFTSHCRQNSDHPLLLQPDAEQTAAATCPRGASQPETIPADEQAAVTAADRSGCE